MNNELQSRRIALMGGAGFVGHHLALALAQRGAQVAVIDSLQVNNLLAFTSTFPATPNRELYYKMIHERLNLLQRANIPVYIQDARDYHNLSSVLGQIQPQAIVHLAAVSHANRSNKDPLSTFDHSLRTLENALECARELKVEHFVYFSSSMVYGNFQTEQVTEDSPLNPIGIYGAMKLAGEKIVIAYQQVFKLPYTIMRTSALYGPRCVSRRVGQIFIENALYKKPITVDGGGTERLDFTYVEDLVDGVIRVLSTPKSLNQTFNLTYGQSRAVNELVEIIQDHFPDVVIQHGQRDELIPLRGTLNIQKARELLGYAPQYPIDIGFPEYIEWYKNL